MEKQHQKYRRSEVTIYLVQRRIIGGKKYPLAHFRLIGSMLTITVFDSLIYDKLLALEKKFLSVYEKHFKIEVIRDFHVSKISA